VLDTDFRVPSLPFQVHAGERIVELRSTVATHLIGRAVDGKDAAQVPVVTTEDAIQDADQPLHNDPPFAYPTYLFYN
jgi:hypothetical protein